MTQPPLDRTPQNEEERQRLEEAQRQLDEVTEQLRAQGIEVEAKAGFLDDQAFVDDVALNEAAVFIKATSFTEESVDARLPVLPVAGIDGLEWLMRAVVAGRVTCDYYGLANEIFAPGGGDPVPMPLSIVFRLVTMGQPTPIYVDVDDAPDEWKEKAMARVVVAWPLSLVGGRLVRPFLATGPMKRFDSPIVIDPVKVSRNDPCPCGSGKKSKKCCFA